MAAGSAPLYTILLSIWLRVFGFSAEQARIFSALLGLGAGLGVYRLLRLSTGRWLSTLGTIMFFSVPVVIRSSITTAPPILTLSLLVWLMERFSHSIRSSKTLPRWWTITLLATGLMYSSNIAWMCVVTGLILVGIIKMKLGEKRFFITSGVASLSLYAPWAAFLAWRQIGSEYLLDSRFIWQLMRALWPLSGGVESVAVSAAYIFVLLIISARVFYKSTSKWYKFSLIAGAALSTLLLLTSGMFGSFSLVTLVIITLLVILSVHGASTYAAQTSTLLLLIFSAINLILYGQSQQGFARGAVITADNLVIDNSVITLVDDWEYVFALRAQGLEKVYIYSQDKVIEDEIGSSLVSSEDYASAGLLEGSALIQVVSNNQSGFEDWLWNQEYIEAGRTTVDEEYSIVLFRPFALEEKISSITELENE